MFCMKSEKVFQAIMKYLVEDSYNYAIMINGEWGCGKTHFIKNLEHKKGNDAKDYRKQVYVSLYGIANVNEIGERVFSRIIELRIVADKNAASKKCSKGVSETLLAGTPILLQFLGNKIGVDSCPELKSTMLSPFVDYNQYYFVFDDLERCKVSIDDVLGYINQFVEQNNAKVIIIANENEMKTYDSASIMLAKYALACEEKIRWPENDILEKAMRVMGNQQTDNEKISLEEMARRSNLIESPDAVYQKVKEKVIGKTLLFEPDIIDVVSTFVNKIDFNNFTIVNFNNIIIEKICLLIEETDNRNWRTLHAALLFFYEVCQCTERGEISLAEYKAGLLDIMTSILVAMIEERSGKEGYNWESSDTEYMTKSEDDLFESNIQRTAFRFVDQYVYQGLFDTVYAQRVLKCYFNDKLVYWKASNDPINILQNFWEMEDKEIERNLVVLYENIKNGDYKEIPLNWLLSLMFKLKEIGFETVSIEAFMALMTENIVSDTLLSGLMEPLVKKDNPCWSEYEECLSTLYNCEEKQKYAKQAEALNSVFEQEEGWGAAFYYCVREKYYNEPRCSILRMLDINLVLNAVRNSAVKDVSDFRRAFYSLFSKRKISAEEKVALENLKSLKAGLCAVDCELMKKYNINGLVTIIEEILNISTLEE